MGSFLLEKFQNNFISILVSEKLSTGINLGMVYNYTRSAHSGKLMLAWSTGPSVTVTTQISHALWDS